MGFDPQDAVFRAHEGGKLRLASTLPLVDRESLSLAYTPGVAEVCSVIAEDEARARDYTWRSRLVAVVSDGTAVLGLGNIGPAAALPVMEGKAALFSEFAGLNAVPVVLSTTDADEIVETVERIAPSFGGINLEDISAPRCFEIEARLRDRLDIPVFHDDQHGTAIVTLAALRNAATVTGRTLADLRVVVSGAGAAGVACTKILLAAGIGDIAVADSKGIVHGGRADLTPVKAELAATTNRAGLTGSLADALVDADVFLGLSAGLVEEDAVKRMAPGSIVFALANPRPEVDPEVAHRYAAVVATGRSDYPNQINNVLAFPGVFAGAFDAGATAITEGMKLAAATALGDVVAEALTPQYIVPTPFDARVAPAVAAAVARQAVVDGVALAAPS
ncbi:malate dehydrogenase (oxaloacetate-decarboxylating) [Jatrophihabitans endophyticus]|uniref:Malate dehydrogenase (Oxaloacetate-decarboxylating) n=1 Tax=Jatrophihabitans endophyticus TaxID=1206085 RepID=A0A1M5E7G6_9ACTN|nr:NADP-dependent malic enzyme [Jatrophihabitans endophyticus]SHF75198.1 malate dehydrogenase (oxaloacetate-decarboxylating) [Jatrophihabitans endophyticus]